MATLSERLRQISSNIQAQAGQQAGTAQAANVMQTQQALTQGQQRAGMGNIRATAQQMAPAVAQAQGQAALQAQAQAGQQVMQATAQAAQQQLGAQQRAQASERMMSDDQIADMQRKGELRQNDQRLRQAKQLQTEDIAAQRRMQQTGIEFDNRLSFLTRKQREDLSSLGRLLKQQVFDSRLQFAADERGRKFSNERQLADYAVASAQDEQQLKARMREMKQAFEKEQIMFEAVQQKIVQAIEHEFQKSEQERDQRLLRQLAEMKRAAEAEQRRKAAKAQAINSIIVGGATIAGAAYGGTGGAAAGSAAGQAVAGGLQSSGAY